LPPSPPAAVPKSHPRSRSTTLQNGSDQTSEQHSSARGNLSTTLRKSLGLGPIHTGPFLDTETHAASPRAMTDDVVLSNSKQPSALLAVTNQNQQQKQQQQQKRSDAVSHDAALQDHPGLHITQPRKPHPSSREHSSSASQSSKSGVHVNGGVQDPRRSASLRQLPTSAMGSMGQPPEPASTALPGQGGLPVLHPLKAALSANNNPACRPNSGHLEPSLENPAASNLTGESCPQRPTGPADTALRQDNNANTHEDGSKVLASGSSTTTPASDRARMAEPSGNTAASQGAASRSPSAIPRASKSPQAVDAALAQGRDSPQNDENRAQAALAAPTDSGPLSRLPSPRSLGPLKGVPELLSPLRGTASGGEPPSFPFKSKSPCLDPTSVQAAAAPFLTQGASESESEHDVRPFQWKFHCLFVPS
jgi:hypothetical protein